MKKKLQSLYGVLLSMFVCVSAVNAGVVSTVTRAYMPGKTVIILHDTHVDASMPSITRSGRTYQTKDVAEWQKDAWQKLFSHDILKLPGKKSLYLEWKDSLIQKSFHAIRTMVASGNYSPHLKFGLADKDFFFEQFIDPFMNPKKNEDRLITCFEHIENVDMRDAVNDAVLALLANPMSWSSVITQARQGWFDAQCEKINRSIERLKSVVSETVYALLIEHAQACEEAVRSTFDRLKINNDITRLPYAVSELNDEALEQLWDDYMQFSCQLFDLPALYRIFDDPHDLVILYCGGTHAKRLVTYLKKEGISCASLDVMTSDALVRKSDTLYNALSPFVSDIMNVHSQSDDLKEVSYLDWLWSPFSWLWTDSGASEKTYNKKHADMPFVHHAASLNDDRMIVYLRDKNNTDVTVCNGNGMSLLDISKATNNTKIANLYNQGRA